MAGLGRLIGDHSDLGDYGAGGWGQMDLESSGASTPWGGGPIGHLSRQRTLIWNGQSALWRRNHGRETMGASTTADAPPVRLQDDAVCRS